MTQIPGTRRIRVVYFSPTLRPGGAERQMLMLAKSLPQAEFDVRFLLLSERGAFAAEAEKDGHSVQVLGLRPEDCSRNWWRCSRTGMGALRRYVSLTRGVDIVDAWLEPAYIFAALAQPLARIPVLVAGRRQLPELLRYKPWYRRITGSWATRRTRAIVANSEAVARRAIPDEHLDPDKVHVIVNAVAPAPVSSGVRTRLRTNWGFDEGHMVVGCVANYRRGKGLEALVEVADHLRARAPHMRFVIAGDGPLRPALVAEILHRGLEATVILHGSEHDARVIYSAFDIAVQASESEGMPNAVLEAAAAGLPVVATAVGGTEEILRSEIDGILVAKGDYSRLGEALVRLAEDADLRERLGRSAQERVLEFSPGRLANATAALYRMLISEAEA